MRMHTGMGAIGLLLVGASWAVAQSPRAGAPVTLRGEVVQVDTVPAMGPAAHGMPGMDSMRPGMRGNMAGGMRANANRAGATGVHVVLRTAKDSTVTVALGPASWVRTQSMRLVKGDKIEVVGTRMAIAGMPGVVATEVKKGGEVLRLRDARGMPLWRGQGPAATAKPNAGP